tara:strand:+ start:1866 stop:2681 length:816 start_codon:yes stop_codon:yes gene_type:complete
VVSLSLDARQVLQSAGISRADYARSWFADGRWHGDTCGCPDDRCIGHHHDADEPCGCIRSILDERKNAPGAWQSTEGNDPHNKGEIMSTVHPNRPTLRPIYGPTDARWQQLIDAVGQKIEIGDMMPSERAAWYEIHVVGNRDYREVAHREVEYPEPPETAGPSWADQRHVESVDGGEYPVITWWRDLAAAESIQAEVSLQRDDTYDPDSGEVAEGVTRATIYIGGNQAEFSKSEDWITAPAQLREIALAFYDAADRWEKSLPREIRRPIGL